MVVMTFARRLTAAVFVVIFPATASLAAAAGDTRLADAAMKRDQATVRKLIEEKWT
jgi:hypothetical protein